MNWGYSTADPSFSFTFEYENNTDFYQIVFMRVSLQRQSGAVVWSDVRMFGVDDSYQYLFPAHSNGTFRVETSDFTFGGRSLWWRDHDDVVGIDPIVRLAENGEYELWWVQDTRQVTKLDFYSMMENGRSTVSFIGENWLDWDSIPRCNTIRRTIPEEPTGGITDE